MFRALEPYQTIIRCPMCRQGELVRQVEQVGVAAAARVEEEQEEELAEWQMAVLYRHTSWVNLLEQSTANRCSFCRHHGHNVRTCPARIQAVRSAAERFYHAGGSIRDYVREIRAAFQEQLVWARISNLA
jgi:hypothetical protein